MQQNSPVSVILLYIIEKMSSILFSVALFAGNFVKDIDSVNIDDAQRVVHT